MTLKTGVMILKIQFCIILKVCSTPKWKFCHYSLTHMSFQLHKSFVRLRNTIYKWHKIKITIFFFPPIRLLSVSPPVLRSVHNLQNGATVTRRDREETNCWKKVIIFFFFRTKYSRLFIKFRLNHWWKMEYSDDAFWTSTVVFTWQSIGQSQTSRVLSKIS